MSDVPPQQPSPAPPPPAGGLPPQYSAYPRGMAYGSADQLQALMEGYYALSLVFLVNLALVVPLNVTYKNLPPGGVLAWILVVFLAVAGLSYGPNKKIAFGKGWSSG